MCACPIPSQSERQSTDEFSTTQIFWQEIAHKTHRCWDILILGSIDKHDDSDDGGDEGDGGDGDDDAIDADHYGSVFWLKASISACRGQLGGRNGNESGGRTVAAHPNEVSRIHKPIKSLQETNKNTQLVKQNIKLKSLTDTPLKPILPRFRFSKNCKKYIKVFGSV